jgi:antitoxin (DNA-binding transcriptional repressor) of toxin-antitoxin stability system
MAQIPNTAAETVSDGLNTYWNVDTSGKHIQQTNADLSVAQSAAAAAIANNGTITTAGVVVARVSPAGPVTGIILGAGTQPGQVCLVVNEAVAANSVTFNTTPATANVADSATASPLYGLQARLFVWDSGTSLWYEHSPLNSGTLAPLQSATAVAIANAGTIATAGVGVSRLNPAAAVTGIIMAAGTIPGQLCLVVNEAAVGNSITFNTTPATANVADSATEAAIPGLQSRLFVWDSATSLWYPVGNPLANGTYVSVQSATAPDPGANGTITTAGVGVARVSPAAARSGIILQAGTYPGQEVTVINEAAAANTLTFNTTPATANVADSATEAAIPGLTARSFVWDSSTSLWYRQN